MPKGKMLNYGIALRAVKLNPVHAVCLCIQHISLLIGIVTLVFLGDSTVS